jgi:tetratricopeptide (TPR) repeat protein
MKKTLLVVLLFLHCSYTQADDRSELLALKNRCLKLEGDWKWQTAIPVARKAMLLSRRVLGRNHIFTAEMTRRLGTYYHSLDQHQQAGPLLKQALRISEDTDGSNYKYLYKYVFALASHYAATNDFERADQLYSRASNLAISHFGRDSVVYSDILFNQGLQQKKDGQWEKAKTNLKCALEIKIEIFGENSHMICGSLLGLGDVYQENKLYGNAAVCFAQALTNAEKYYITDNPERASHPRIGMYRWRLGDLFDEMKNYIKAEQYLRSALVFYEEYYGPNHNYTKNVKRSLASVESKMLEQQVSVTQ